MVEYAPSNEPEAGKRRSTRIVQAIPVTVAGVDALGQPFRERTSTLIVNCHGFKYQSKHYVLKGTWLEMEVLHPEADKAPRKVRGQVTFVQRPRTAKELFQVGVEMDTPGNVWGVAFPPDDWFDFPEEGAEAVPRPPVKAAPVASAPAVVSPPAAIPSAPPPVIPSERVLRPAPPIAPPAVSESVNQQVARMLADAQNQIRQAAREAGAEAISREAASLLRDLNIQLKVAAEKAVEQASTGYADQVARKALKKIEEAKETSAQELRATLAREFEADLRGLSQGVLSNLTQSGEAFRKEFLEKLTADVTAANSRLAEIESRVKEMQEQIAGSTAAIPSLLENAQKEIGAFTEAAKQQWSEQLQSRAEEALSRLAKLEEAAGGLRQQIQSASDSAQSNWQQRLEKDLAEAKARLEKVVSSTYAGAEKHLAEQMAKMSSEAAARVTTTLDKGTADVRASVESAMAEAERRVAALQTSLAEGLASGTACAAEMRSISAQVATHSKQLEELAQKAGDEVVRQFEEMLAANREQLSFQADSVLAGLAQRLEPALAERGTEMVSRVAAEVEKKVASQVHRADDAIKHLTELEAGIAATLRQEQARLQSEFEKNSQKVLARCLEELDGKTTNATHETFEQLYKSAEWYQRKAQASMQTAFEKGITQATTHMREKAAEISTLFASELDHYSRSYSEHTQGLLDEAAKEMASRIRAQVVETTEAGAAKFSDEVHHLAEDKVERLRATSGSVVEEARARLAMQVENVCGELEARSALLTSEFQTRVAERLRQSVNEAKQEFQAQLVPVLETWRAEARANQEQWLQSLDRKGNESVEQFKLRLENVSNSWMVAAVTTLSQHSQGVLDSLAQAVEQRLRDTCAEVFAGVGENMRQRLLGMSEDLKKKEQ
ncbi:MAG: hypothetical protein M1453_04845 [Acidobacteria bacterium]|nr:hypothetical protein [Acidobacteriota bacterium]MCL5287309.1 hypothetical protein [Acidobacteriota bacterium]